MLNSLLLFWLCLVPTAHGFPLLLSAEGSSRATAYGNADKIARIGDNLYTTFLNRENGTFSVKVAQIDAISGSIKQMVTVGTSSDNHGAGSLHADGHNRLHIFFGAHSSPLQYRYSRPDDISQWSDTVLLDDQITYPAATVRDSGEILIVARGRNGYIPLTSPPADLRLLRVKNGALVESKSLFVSNQQPDAFSDRYASYLPQIFPGPGGKLHLVFYILERPTPNPMGNVSENFGYAVGYMESGDEGKTWHDSRGGAYSLPTDLNKVELIAGVRSVAAAEQTFDHVSAAVHPVTGEVFAIYDTYRWKEGKWETWLSRRAVSGWKQTKVGNNFLNSILSFDRRAHLSVLAEKSFATQTLPPSAAWASKQKKIVALVSKSPYLCFEEREVSGFEEAGAPYWLPALERDGGGGKLFGLFTSGAEDRTKVYLSAIPER